MKLRNKKTGEIYKGFLADLALEKHYASLAELNEEWEDYKEPRYYYIDRDGHIVETQNTRFLKGLDNKIYDVELAKSIGNIFTTQEEAEEAVEKLKAWKRLKDTIIRIDRASFDYAGTATLFIRYEEEDYKKVKKDLDLLFGGEDE